MPIIGETQKSGLLEVRLTPPQMHKTVHGQETIIIWSPRALPLPIYVKRHVESKSELEMGRLWAKMIV